ncbi:hypothetical protein BJ878DRAFT_483775 [Calycina marina]|uniref:Uncharacterized protein n=1 Tax=Calycina marina TaxID=1763456 RepID=A0A9P8CBF0_9HELO|nr:hypothetical protein BJ878DRAFT_483775 [Calycina marina]
MENTARKHVKTIHENNIQILSSGILVPKRLETCFDEILERGNVIDDLPQSLEVALSSPTQYNTIARRSPRAFNNHVTRYFEAIGIEADRARLLAKLVRSFENAQQLNHESYSHLWRDEKEFGEHEVGLGRTDRLHRLRQLFEEGSAEKASAEHDSAARLCLMFSVIEVVHYSLIADMSDLKLKRGRRRIAAAWERFGQDDSISKKSMKTDKMRSRNYFHLLRKNDPGSLLELAPGSSSGWEVKAYEEDVDLALEYRKTRLPELEQRAAALNAIGARTIVCGLLAYGWTFAEVSSSPIPFLKLVRAHLDEILEIPTSLDGSESPDSPSQTDCKNNGRTVDKDFASICDQSSGDLESKKRPFRTHRSADEICLLPADSVIRKKCRKTHSPTSSQIRPTPEEVNKCSIGAGSADQNDFRIDEDWMRLLDSSGSLPCWERIQDPTECPASSVGQSFGEETDDQDWIQLLNASGDLPDPLSFDSRPATVDPRFLGTEATVPDELLRSDSHGLTNVHQSMDLFGSG